MPRDHVDPTHHQVAQASGGGAAQPIGRVDTLTGTATAQHVDGSTVTLHQGDAVYQKDLIATQGGAKIALVFADKTTFALGESGQLRLDELVYDPTGAKSGKMAVSMLKGAFAFVSGDIAGKEAEAMTVRTPVGTIGIRGTAVAGSIDPTGGGSTIAAVPDPSGASSTVVFTNAAGTQVLTENTMLAVLSFFSAPGAPTAITAGALGEAGDLSFIAGTISTTVNPGGSSGAGTTGGGAPPPGGGPQGGGEGGGGPTIHVTETSSGDLGGGGPTFTFTFDFGQQTTHIDTTVAPISPPPPPPHVGPTAPAGFIGHVGVDNFQGHPGVANLFDFVTNHNSLESGDHIVGGGGNDTLNALFDKSFGIDSTLVVTNVPNIHLTLGGGPNSLDAANITSGSAGVSTITVDGTGALTVSHLKVYFDGHALSSPLSVTADTTGAGDALIIEGGAGSNTLTGAGFGHGDALSYAHATVGVDLIYAPGTAAAPGTATHGGSTDQISGFDAIVGSAFGDNINVSGVGHAVTVEGGAGNNTLAGSLGDSDTVSYVHAEHGVSIDLSAGVALDNGYGAVPGTDMVSGFVTVLGSFHDDRFVTTDTTASIKGVAGHDSVILGGTIANHLTVTGVDSVTSMSPAGVSSNLTVNPIDNFFSVDLSTSTGNDVISVASGAGGGTILDGNGNDSITVALGAFDFIAAGNGNDVISVSGAFNTITAGNGADAIVVSGDFNAITASNGDDAITVNGSVSAITVGNGNNVITANGDHETITFGSGTDLITVSGGGHNLIQDLAGPVVHIDITAGGNDTILLSGASTDVISDSGGGNVVTVGTGNDSIALGGGGNTVSAGTGSDTITVNGTGSVITAGPGGLGDDSITAGSFDAITVGNGNNTIMANGGHETITFGTGTDLITINGGGHNLVQDGPGVFVSIDITAGGNDTILLGGAAVDSITDSGGGNVVTVGAGDDTIALGGGSNTITAGDGNDMISIAGATGLHLGSAGGGSFTVHDTSTGGFDAITLNGGDDGLSFFGNNSSIDTSAGDDVVSIMGDHNLVVGSTGDDVFTASGVGNILAFDSIGGPMSIDASVGQASIIGSDDVISFNGFDSLIGTGFDDTINGAGTMTIDGEGGNNVLGVAGNNPVVTLSYQSSEAGVDVNLGLGTATHMQGGLSGDDTLLGPFFGVIGSQFNDTIDASGGPDFVTVEGAGGNNSLIGNGCDDALSFAHAPSGATIFLDSFSPIRDGSGTAINGYGGTDTYTGFADFIGSAGFDNLTLAASNNCAGVSVTGIEQVRDLGTFDNVTMLGLGNSFDVQLGSGSTLTLELPGSTTMVFGFHPGDAPLVTSLLDIEDAPQMASNYHLTFDGSVPGMEVEACNMGTFFFDASAEPSTASFSVFGTSPGNDTILTGSGADFIQVYGVANSVASGNGNDTVDASSSSTGADTIVVGNGNDSILISWGLNSITAGNGSDTITDNGGTIVGGDTVTVGNGNDVIYLTGSNDSVTTGSGDDVITVGTGSTVMGGGHDVVHLFSTGDDDLLTVSNVSSINIVGGAIGHTADVTVTGAAFGANPGFDLSADGTGHLTFDVIGPSSLSFFNFGSSGGTSQLHGVQTLTLQGGSYDLSFDIGFGGTAMTIDGSQLGAASTLGFHDNGSGFSVFDVLPGAGADTLNGQVSDTLDYHLSSLPVTLTVTNAQNSGLFGGEFEASGSGTSGTAAGDSFTNFGHLVGTNSGADVIVLGAGGNVHAVDLLGGRLADTSVDLGCGVTISGFSEVIDQTASGSDLRGNGSATIVGGAGADTLTANGSDNFVYLAGSDSFASAGAVAADGNTDQVAGFQDGVTTIDLTSLAGAGTETFNATPKSFSTDFATTFASQAANEVDYTFDGSNTYIHVSGTGGGYSAGDLLIQLQGNHTPTAANFHLHT